jgi:hypothetical protein
MQMKVVVDDQAGYEAWLAKQKTVGGHAASTPTAMK